MEIQRCCGGFFRVSGNVSWKDAAVHTKEIKLLAVLLENAGQVVSRDQILDRIWGEEESPFDRVVDVYVKNLRKKLQLDCIITVKGVGYKLELP